MRHSMWTYPWDLQDVGLDAATADLRDRAGMNSVSLAVSYHAGRFFQPRSPRRKAYFPQDGTIYFTPDPMRWTDKEIQPLVADNLGEGGDMLAELLDRGERSGLATACWTVCLHNTRLGMLHPMHVTRNAFGDPNYYNLCPSSPAARDYLITLLTDLTHNYRPAMVELESPNFMGFAHGYHHEKDGVGLLAEDQFLLSLCFCPHCVELSSAAGVNAEAAQASVRGLLEEICEREVPETRFPSFPGAGIDAFGATPELHDFLAWRSTPVTTLIADIRAAVHPDSKIVLIGHEHCWRGGMDLASIGPNCDGVILCAYDKPPEAGAALIAEGHKTLGKDKYVGFGCRAFYPEIRSAADLVARTRAAIEAGADGINFYNYGLIPAKRLDWVRACANDVGA